MAGFPVKYNMYYQMKENPKLLETMDPYDYVYNTWAYMKKSGEILMVMELPDILDQDPSTGNHLNEYKNMTTHNYMK